MENQKNIVSDLEKSEEYSKANCMGFALGNDKWLVPKNWRHYEDYFYEDDNRAPEDELTGYEFLEQRLRLIVEELLSIFDIKVVLKEDMEIGKNYIAYREAVGDFHFMYRLSSGKWMHKMGGSEIKSISEEDVFVNEWNNGWNSYDSQIILFEVLNKS